jgi:hypothetical protein
MCSEILRDRGLTLAIVKLAQPLYELQQAFYAAAGRPISADAQDQALLELIARELRRISPTSLVDDFRRRVVGCDADVLLNDDLRDPFVDWPALRDDGFRFVRLVCDDRVRAERAARRGDISTVLHSQTTADIDLIQPDYVIDNSTDDPDHLRAALVSVIDDLL